MRVVLVHGFTQTAASWEPIEREWRDLPIEPLAVEVPAGLAFRATAEAIGEEGGTATYAGYSMGGRLCLQLALDRPEVVERLVLVSAAPGIADPAERATRRDADETLALEVERDGVAMFVERWLAQPLFASLPPEASGIEERKRSNTVDGLTHQLRELGQGSQPPAWERLAEITMPTLLIVGELDRKYVDIAQRMAESITDVRVEVIPGAGHACHLEQPEAVSQLVASW